MAVLIVAVLVVILVAGTNGQSSTCTNALISLSPCLNYITGNTTTPSSSCCTQLASVVGSEPQCLCQVVNGGASSLGITVNQTQALALPSACNVQTQPISRCIAGSPAVSPAGTPATPGSKNTPSTDSSGSSAIQSSLSAFLMVALVASYATAS